MNPQLDKFFDYKNKEKEIAEMWEKSGIYRYQGKSDAFKIDTPPPTVSGFLHMGHVFSYVQADIIARYMRMMGRDVFYPIGFDDNGLPTERLVEKQTGKKVGKNCSKDEFVAICQEVVDEAERDFEHLFRQIGLSVDWNLKYQTISEKTREVAHSSFLDLFKKGLIYQKFAPVYWDCADKTALAQADIEDKEVDGFEVVFTAKVFDGEAHCGEVQIMTTRPEMLPACVAVFCKTAPNWLKSAKNPVVEIPYATNSRVPLLQDDDVLEEKGTGFVMCCAFGDMQDKIWIERHNLAEKIPSRYINAAGAPEILRKGLISTQNFITDSGLLNDPIFLITLDDGTQKYLNVEQGRKYISQKLLEDRRIVGSVEFVGTYDEALSATEVMLSHKKHTVKCAERSGKPVEILFKNQWYVSVMPFKRDLLMAAGEIAFHPAHMKVRLEQWIEGLNQDWCISRDRFFGVDIPYFVLKLNTEGTPEIAEKIAACISKFDGCLSTSDSCFGFAMIGKNIDAFKANLAKEIGDIFEIEAEKGVLDTWFTSSISPSIAWKSLEETPVFDLRPQAHEIIRTWAFYTISKTYLHSLELKSEKKPKAWEVFNSRELFKMRPSPNIIPWKNVMLSGWCLAADKSKMSKSKGNVVTPTKLIEEKGVDAVRYWCASSGLGVDTAYSEDLLELGKKFTTKLWNVAKFVILKPISGGTSREFIKEAFDLWILARLSEVVDAYHKAFKEYEYAAARRALDDFFWHDLCDNYLEIIKVRFYGAEALIYKDSPPKNPEDVRQKQLSALHALNMVFENLLKLYAPFVPFITDELYRLLYSQNGGIHAEILPTGIPISSEFLLPGKKALEVIEIARKVKTERNLPMNAKLDHLECSTEGIDIGNFAEDLKNVTGVLELKIS